jgi:hypothetical protein
MKELCLMSKRGDTDAAGGGIDRLFQLPLSEFTGARNELAKSSGADAAAIRGIEKPNIPAWAVNQLYWRDRRTYDALVKASERLRAAHAHALAGKKIDLPMLELHHTAALKTAADSIRRLLSLAGDAATPATMKAVIDTLQALPGGGQPGRLSRPLSPLGFGALGALMKHPGARKTLAEVVTFAPRKPKPPTKDEAAEQSRRAREAAIKRLGELDKESARARKALAAAKAAFDRADRTRGEFEKKLEGAVAELGVRRNAVDRAERENSAIEEERARLRKEI